MTPDRAKTLYLRAGGPDDHSPDEWADIHKEIEAIVAAPSDLSAGRVIDWWGCWDRKRTSTAFARKVRKLHKEAAQ